MSLTFHCRLGRSHGVLNDQFILEPRNFRSRAGKLLLSMQGFSRKLTIGWNLHEGISTGWNIKARSPVLSMTFSLEWVSPLCLRGLDNKPFSVCSSMGHGQKQVNVFHHELPVAGGSSAVVTSWHSHKIVKIGLNLTRTLTPLLTLMLNPNLIHCSHSAGCSVSGRRTPFYGLLKCWTKCWQCWERT